MNHIDPYELFEEAQNAFETKNYRLAEKLLQQLVLTGHSSLEVFHMLATLYHDQGRLKQALKLFKKVLQLDPTHTEAGLAASMILNDLGQYEEGARVFKRTEAQLKKTAGQPSKVLQKELFLKHLELGQLYEQAEDDSEALTQYLKALPLSPDSQSRAETGLAIAEGYVRLKKEHKAIQQLRFILQEVPDFVPARQRVAELLHQQGKQLVALAQWETILSTEPNHPGALHELKSAQQSGANVFL